MDDLRLQALYTQASTHEPNDEEMKVIDFLLDMQFSDQNEAVVIAYLVGRLAGDIYRHK